MSELMSQRERLAGTAQEGHTEVDKTIAEASLAHELIEAENLPVALALDLAEGYGGRVWDCILTTEWAFGHGCLAETDEAVSLDTLIRLAKLINGDCHDQDREANIRALMRLDRSGLLTT